MWQAPGRSLNDSDKFGKLILNEMSKDPKPIKTYSNEMDIHSTTLYSFLRGGYTLVQNTFKKFEKQFPVLQGTAVFDVNKAKATGATMTQKGLDLYAACDKSLTLASYSELVPGMWKAKKKLNDYTPPKKGKKFASFAQALKFYRIEAGMEGKALAKKLGYSSPSVVWHIEKDKNPTEATYRLLLVLFPGLRHAPRPSSFARPKTGAAARGWKVVEKKSKKAQRVEEEVEELQEEESNRAEPAPMGFTRVFSKACRDPAFYNRLLTFLKEAKAVRLDLPQLINELEAMDE